MKRAQICFSLGKPCRRGITRAIEEMVGMPVAAVDVYIDGVLLQPPDGSRAGEQSVPSSADR